VADNSPMMVIWDIKIVYQVYKVLDAILDCGPKMEPV